MVAGGKVLHDVGACTDCYLILWALSDEWPNFVFACPSSRLNLDTQDLPICDSVLGVHLSSKEARCVNFLREYISLLPVDAIQRAHAYAGGQEGRRVHQFVL